MDTLLQDLRYALRTLRRNAGFTLVVVAMLALGIAANTTVFSIINPYLLRELPFGDAERLFQIGQVDPVHHWDAARFSLPQYEDWKARSHAFEDMAAYHYGPRNLTGREDAERVMVGVVTGNMFSVLRAPAELGRTFTPADGGPGGRDVVVLARGIWMRRYGGDPDIIGRSIYLDGVAHTVVGVMGPEFNFPWNEVRMWTPMRADPAREPRTNTSHIIVGRLHDGWTAERAADELAAIQRELGAVYPDADGRFAGVTVRPLREALNFAYDVVRAASAVLAAATAVVLLIACVNVAGLALARATARTREVALRMALGAGRGRVVRQLLVESTVLALAGGGIGVLLSDVGIAAIGSRLPEGLYRVGTATLDGRVLLFSVALTLATPILFGLTPALAATRAHLSEAIQGGGRGAGVSRRTLRGRRGLVVAQVALAVVLLTGAGLMIRSFLAVRQVDLGFDAERVLVAELTPPARDYESPEALEGYYDRATAALAALPGVRIAAAVNPLPLNHENIPLQFARPEAAGVPKEEWPVALQARTAPGYFYAMGIPILAGRDFGSADGPDAPPVVIVSRVLAERHWPGENPVGRTLMLPRDPEPVAATVVGVVADVRHESITGEPRPHVYRPMLQAPTRHRFLVVAAAGGEPGALARAVRGALAGVDPNLPVTLRPMREIVVENDFQWRISSVALGAFGGVALFLAALGLYGIIAYSVAQRRRELAIRLALGAGASQICRLVVREGLRLTATGIAVGIVLALAAGRLLSSQLFGVRPVDPATLVGVLLLFVAVAALASAHPAARAAALPPHDVLREE